MDHKASYDHSTDEAQEFAGQDPDDFSDQEGYAARVGRTEFETKGLQLIEASLEILTDNEKAVYVAIYRNDENQSSVADEMNLTQGRVSQLLASALKKITNYCRAKAGPDL